MLDPKKTYSLREITLLGVMGKTASTVTRKIYEDLANDNMLQPIIAGSPGARRYRILGQNIINYLK